MDGRIVQQRAHCCDGGDATRCTNWPGGISERVEPEFAHVVFAVVEGGDVAVEIAVVAENNHLEIATMLSCFWITRCVWFWFSCVVLDV